MDVLETYEVIALMDSLNPYARTKSDEELDAQADTWTLVLAEVPKVFAMDYIGNAAREGRTVREITEVTGAWRRLRAQRMERAGEVLAAPEALADDADAWLAWTRTSRQVYGATGSLERARDAANEAVGYRPELEPAVDSEPVSEDESQARMKAIMRTQRIERALGGEGK